MVRFSWKTFTLVFLAMSLTACFKPGPIPNQIPTTRAPQPPTSLPNPVSPIQKTGKPTLLQQPIEPTASGPSSIKIFLVAVDDGGKSGNIFGCNDSLVPVDVDIQPTSSVLRASFEKILSIKNQYYGGSGLYNSLYQSDLKLDSLTLNNGSAEIRLSGKLVLGGECDNPRVQAQLEGTALQFSTVQRVTIFINGKLLKEVLSLKG